MASYGQLMYILEALYVELVSKPVHIGLISTHNMQENQFSHEKNNNEYTSCELNNIRVNLFVILCKHKFIF